MRVGIASDHGGFALKEEIAYLRRCAAHEVVDFGVFQLSPGDDSPDKVIGPALAWDLVEDDDMNVFSLGGTGLIHDVFSAHQGVETFIKARFSSAERHQRRVDKVKTLELQEAAR